MLSFILNILIELIVDPIVWIAGIYLIYAKIKGKEGKSVKIAKVVLIIIVVIEVLGACANLMVTESYNTINNLQRY